jgi:biopolymer transport protein TolR
MRTVHHGQTLSEINVTPFVDVVLVLLIIFMITAPLLSQGLDVELPEATAPGLTRSEEDIIITIDKEGRLFILSDPEPYTIETIGAKLQAVFKHRDKKELLLRADRKSLYGVVVQSIAAFKEAGIERVGMMTEEKKEKK